MTGQCVSAKSNTEISVADRETFVSTYVHQKSEMFVYSLPKQCSNNTTFKQGIR